MKKKEAKSRGVHGPIVVSPYPGNVVKITPEFAAHLLENNTRNRSMGPSYVDRYAKAMLEGQWHLTLEPILVAKDGTLLQGQHRLQACVESGVPFVTAFSDKLDPAVFPYLDAGKSRSSGDDLTVKGEKRSKVLAGALSVLWRYQNEKLQGKGIGFRPTRPQVLSLFERNKRIRSSVEFIHACRASKIVSPSVLSAIHYLASKKDADLANEFFENLGSGEDLSSASPVYKLRERLIRNKTSKRGKLHQDEIFALTAKAWNAFFADRPMVRLAHKPSDPIPHIA